MVGMASGMCARVNDEVGLSDSIHTSVFGSEGFGVSVVPNSDGTMVSATAAMATAAAMSTAASLSASTPLRRLTARRKVFTATQNGFVQPGAMLDAPGALH